MCAVNCCVVVINCDYRNESAGFVNTRFTEYSWRGAKLEFIHSVTVYVCCQEDTFSVNHGCLIWSLREAGTETTVAKNKSLEVLESSA